MHLFFLEHLDRTRYISLLKRNSILKRANIIERNIFLSSKRVTFDERVWHPVSLSILESLLEFICMKELPRAD